MPNPNLIAGIVLIAIGLFFITFFRSVAKGAAAFYKKIYTEKNLKIMFMVMGCILIVAGLVLLFRT